MSSLSNHQPQEDRHDSPFSGLPTDAEIDAILNEIPVEELDQAGIVLSEQKVSSVPNELHRIPPSYEALIEAVSDSQESPQAWLSRESVSLREAPNHYELCVVLRRNIVGRDSEESGAYSFISKNEQSGRIEIDSRLLPVLDHIAKSHPKIIQNLVLRGAEHSGAQNNAERQILTECAAWASRHGAGLPCLGAIATDLGLLLARPGPGTDPSIVPFSELKSGEKLMLDAASSRVIKKNTGYLLNEILFSRAGIITPPDVLIGRGLTRCLELTRANTITVDIDLLSLEPALFQAVLNASVDHMNRFNSYAAGDPIHRHRAAFFADALHWLEAPQQVREALLKGYEALGANGWETKGYQALVNGTNSALNMQAIPKILGRADDISVSWHHKRAMQELRRALIVEGCFAGDVVLHEASLLSTAPKRNPGLDHCCLPTHTTASILAQACGSSDESEIGACVALNAPLLKEIMHRGWPASLGSLSSLFHYFPLDFIRKDLPRGAKSLLAHFFISEQTPTPEALEVRRPISGIATGRAVIGQSSMLEVIASLDLPHREIFGRALANAFEPLAQDARDNLAIGQLVLDMRERWVVSGIDYLLKSRSPQTLFSLLKAAQALDFSELGHSAPILTDARDKFLHHFCARWGIALGQLDPSFLTVQVRGENGIRAGLAQAVFEAQNRADQPRTPEFWRSIFTLCLALQLTPSPNTMACARDFVSSQIHFLLKTKEEVRSPQLRAAEVAFDLLLRSGPAMAGKVCAICNGELSKSQNISDFNRTRLFDALESAPQGVAARGLLSAILSSGISDETARIQTICRALDKMDQKEWEKFINDFFPNGEALVQRLSAIKSADIKTILIDHIPTERLTRFTRTLDVDVVRQIYAGIDAEKVVDVTKSTIGRTRSIDVVQREIYESAVAELPLYIDNYVEGGTIINHFVVLCVPRNAAPDVVKNSYRRLAHLYHEDRFGNETPAAQEEAGQRFRLINNAYQVLSDPKARMKYLQQIPNRANCFPMEPWMKGIPQEVASRNIS